MLTMARTLQKNAHSMEGAAPLFSFSSHYYNTTQLHYTVGKGIRSPG